MSRTSDPHWQSEGTAARAWFAAFLHAPESRLPHNFYAPFDAKTLTDPLAQRIRWTPITAGGPDVVLFELTTCGPDCLSLRPLPVAYIVSRGLIALGSIWLLFAIPEWLGPGGFWATLPEILLATFFVAAGVGLVWLFRQSPMVFDRMHGICSRSRPFYLSPSVSAEAWDGSLADVHAIQILPEYVHHRRGGFWAYEINLILNNGVRVGVLHHHHLAWIDRDAKRLAEFLGKPIWDARVPADPTSPA